MTLHVLTPMRVEARAVARALPDASVAVTGVGPARARAGVGQLPAGDDPVAVVGFCGALDPTLEPGDVVVATEVRSGRDTMPVPTAGTLVAALEAMGISARAGPVVSVPQPARGSERSRLSATGAIAVDMESGELARAVGPRPLAVLRVVLDTPHAELVRPGTALRAARAYRAMRRAAPALARWAAAAGPRRVLLAGPRSFCAGVERAIRVVELALERFGAPVYVRKQIVHNLHVVRDLEARGAIFVEELDEVPAGATVIFSAHGVAPTVREQAGDRELQVIDATCPLVTKVHTEARRFAASGYRVVLIGHAGHEETEGTMGEIPGSISLVETPEDAAALPIGDGERLAYLTQTTLAVDEVAGIVDTLRQRHPDLAGPRSDDICYATQNRQDAVRAVAADAELVLVVGSTNSSNSNRLVEVARRAGRAAHLLDDDRHLDPHWLAGVGTVAVTAGASAPESMVDRIVEVLSGFGPIDVQERSVTTESIHFNLPVEVRR